MSAVFAFLLASAEVMYTSHDVVLSTQFIRISACLFCVVYLLDLFSMVDCLQNLHFFGELKVAVNVSSSGKACFEIYLLC